MTEINLKPCPFCGGEAKLTNLTQAPESWVECTVCGARTRFFSNNNEAPVSTWNTRHAEDDEIKYQPTSYSCRACKNATDNEIKRLREALEFYADVDMYEYYDKYETTAIHHDYGQKARDCLKEIKK